MKKKVTFFTLLFIVIISMVIFNIIGEKEELDVTVRGQTIKYITLENNYEDSEDLFAYTFEEGNSEHIQYIEIGEKIYIDFGNNPPDRFIIKDHLLSSEGKVMYTKKEILDIPVTGHNDKYYFVVNKHMASALSSYYEENKKDYRWFSIITNTEETEKVYNFVIMTDAF